MEKEKSTERVRQFECLARAVLRAKAELLPGLAGPDFPHKDIVWRFYDDLTKVECEALQEIAAENKPFS